MKKIAKKLLLCALSACLCCSIAGFAACSDGEDSSKPGTSVSDSTSVSGSEANVTVELNQTSCRLAIGEAATLTATVSDGSSVTWSSADEDVATVANGVVTAVGAGTTKIIATAKGVTAECTVEVYDNSPLEFTLDTEEAIVLAGGIYEVKYTALQSGKPQNVTVAWSSDREDIASVSDQGKITGVKKGTATITAKTTFNGQEYVKTIAVTVNNDVELVIIRNDPSVPEREMNLSMLSGDVYPTSEKVGIELYANGETKENPAVTWTPADSNIVSVENGLITATGIGSTRVTISYDGEPEATSTYIDVTVNPMRIDKSENDLMVMQKSLNASKQQTKVADAMAKEGITGDIVEMRWEDGIVAEGETTAIEFNEKGVWKVASAQKVPYGRQTAYILTSEHKEYKVTVYVTGMRIVNVASFKNWQKTSEEHTNYAVLDADLDFKGADYSVAVNAYFAGLNPSGVAFNFSGTFDGRGHTIKNASVRWAQSALICNTLNAGGVIKNVAFDHIEVVGNSTGYTALGGVVSGVAKNATIENVFIRGTLGDTNLSGLLAYYSLGTIKNCVAVLENSPAIDADKERPARGILGCSILPQAGAFENCVAIGLLPGVACWRERKASGDIPPHKFGNVEINEDGADVTQYMTNCYHLAEAGTVAGLDLAKFGEYWDTTGAVPTLGDINLEVSVPATILMRESEGVKIQSSAYVSFALKAPVTGVTLEGNLLTVDDTAQQDATVTVVATSTLNGKFVTELTFTIDIMAHRYAKGDFAYFSKTAQNDVTIDLNGILQENEKVTAVKTLGGAEIIALDKIADDVATISYQDWSKELVNTGETALLVYTDKNVVYHLTVVVADYVVGSVEEYKAWHIANRGEFVANKVVGGYVVLAGDIDFANEQGEKADYSVSYIENSGKNQFMFRFNGTFDGRGHSISNVIVSRTQSGIIAGSLELGGAIRNVALKGIVLTGDTVSGQLGWEGGIVDFIVGGVIENCYAEGEIKDDTAAIGRTVDGRGLICSRVTNGKVRNCVAVLTNTIANVENTINEETKGTPANVGRAVLGNMLGVPANSDAFTNCIAIGKLYGVCSQATGGAMGSGNFPNGFKDPNSDMSGAFENINSYETVAGYKEAAADVNAKGFLVGNFWDFSGDVPVIKAN